MDILNDIKKYLIDECNSLCDLCDNTTSQIHKEQLVLKWQEARHIHLELSVMINEYLSKHKED